MSGFGFGVYGFRVWGFGLSVSKSVLLGLEVWFQGLRFRVCGLGFRHLCFMSQGFQFGFLYSGLWLGSEGFQGLGF